MFKKPLNFGKPARGDGNNHSINTPTALGVVGAARFDERSLFFCLFLYFFLVYFLHIFYSDYFTFLLLGHECLLLFFFY